LVEIEISAPPAAAKAESPDGKLWPGDRVWEKILKTFQDDPEGFSRSNQRLEY